MEVKHVSFNCRHGSETRAGASTRRARRSAYPTGDVTGLFYGYWEYWDGVMLYRRCAYWAYAYWAYVY